MPIGQEQWREDSNQLRSSVKGGLLGLVTERMLGVTAGIDIERRVSIIAYYDGAPTEADEEDFFDLWADVISDFKQPVFHDGREYYALVQLAEARDYGGKAMPILDFWGFLGKRALRFVDRVW